MSGLRRRVVPRLRQIPAEPGLTCSLSAARRCRHRRGTAKRLTAAPSTRYGPSLTPALLLHAEAVAAADEVTASASAPLRQRDAVSMFGWRLPLPRKRPAARRARTDLPSL